MNNKLALTLALAAFATGFVVLGITSGLTIQMDAKIKAVEKRVERIEGKDKCLDACVVYTNSLIDCEVCDDQP